MADQGVFYLLNRSGAYVCDSETGDYQFVNLSPTPSQIGTGGKNTWTRVGWSERNIVLMDNQCTVYHIPRHQKDFPASEPTQRHRIGFIAVEHEKPGQVKLPQLGRPMTYRFRTLEAVLMGNTRQWRRKVGEYLPDPEPFFEKCFRVRQLTHPKLLRYTRTDKWLDRTAQVFGGAEKGTVESRSVAVVDGTIEYEFVPHSPMNDVCFSTDGLVLYMLYQNGTVIQADVE